MSDIYRLATISNFQGFGHYKQFMENASQVEFSESQVPFYHAVKAFPRALCYLGSLIEDSSVRMSLAENIWEEHGNGDMRFFHINTFEQYLMSISGGYQLSENPWITEWIRSWFSDADTFRTALRLSAIEYLYAPVSDALSQHIETLSLYNEQSHYKKHAVLDWEHGRELLDIALQYQNVSDEQALELFNQYQQEFLDVFNGMIISTKKEVESISKEKVAFYYLREDSSVTVDAIVGPNIITVCSGGESVLSMLSMDRELDIIALDMNPNQFQVLEDKIALLSDGLVPDKMDTGKFERLFRSLRERFSDAERTAYLNGQSLPEDKLRYALKDIFSRSNLSHIFTEEATKYTQKDFADHFFKVFSRQYQNGYARENMLNIFCEKTFHYPSRLNMDNKHVRFMQDRVTDGDFFRSTQFRNGQKADIIDLSNIGDWVPASSLDDIIKRSAEHLNQGGSLIMRKLLGDYDLSHLFEKHDLYIMKSQDAFYEETLKGVKK